MPKVYHSSNTCEWSTPPGFAEQYGPFDLDPCATAENAKAPAFFTQAEDGLAQQWHGRVWMNPPFGREIGHWIKKAYEEVQAGRVSEAVCLIPARTDTRWWHEFVVKGSIEFIRGRLRFGGATENAPFPCAVVTFQRLHRMTPVRTRQRPALRYHGGKWMLAPWILGHFPEHRIYVEPYGGGGSVLLRKARSYAEVYNDLDGEIVNLFAVLRDHGCELRRLVELTPFSRTEFVKSYAHSEDPIERARRTLVRAAMGFGSASVSGKSTGFRAHSKRSGSTPSHDWMNYPCAMVHIIDRLRGVTLENKDAMAVMKDQDSEVTLHYVDPPYVRSTRNSSGKSYRFEMSDDDHRDLAKFLRTLKGKVVVSGYQSDLYQEIYAGWRVVTRAAWANGKSKRTECLWLNFSPSLGLFDPEGANE